MDVYEREISKGEKIREKNSKANHIRLKSKENQLQNDARTGESRLRVRGNPPP